MIELSDDPRRIDLDRVHGWLTMSYWTPGIARDRVARQNAGSHCLGAYHIEHGQVGFARVISDKASFAWLADVWVDEAARGQGLGRRMVRWFLEHPDYATVRRFALVTADAHGVYQNLGFHAPLKPERYMERLSNEFADLLSRAAEPA
ncbi:GNAT superfamily N-acetyltransferase [Novosphingobium chloroacetimidivorans]|uniref:GNAT superfamily N-acetyltransferase n=1 Tax=Novosphingobium chloroacetimidivorans TaxID=1428314 RepID=A0A7W7NVQ1_9SPHN|nr:GNAT family N-acetyltransferase [Novosphingobium chloroacetimidivorans]MBB4857539.1 GNAT superfamily N-acetyltransferase [Novosphingobium chloroacetimidivorans]